MTLLMFRFAECVTYFGLAKICRDAGTSVQCVRHAPWVCNY